MREVKGPVAVIQNYKYKAGQTVRITTDIHAYQGLMKDSIHRLDHDADYAIFTANGKLWTINDEQFELMSVRDKIKFDSSKKPIKSDGGSSSYYDIDLPSWLLGKLDERRDQGKVYIKTEELIEVMLDSDFDAGNILKSLVRAYGSLNGGGKEGNDVTYEVNKIKYSADKLNQRFQRKQN